MVGRARMKIKVVVVGDEASCKFELLHTFASGRHPDDYVYKPARYNDYTITVIHDGEPVEVKLWNTGMMRPDRGTEPTLYDRLRPLVYPETNAFLVCFSVVSPPPLEIIKEMWIPELRQHCPDTPFLLVGTETDLRHDAMTVTEEEAKVTEERTLTPEKGRKLAQEVRAAMYVECSARTQDGVKNVFEEAVAIAVRDIHRSRKPPGRNRRIVCTVT